MIDEIEDRSIINRTASNVTGGGHCALKEEAKSVHQYQQQHTHRLAITTIHRPTMAPLYNSLLLSLDAMQHETTPDKYERFENWLRENGAKFESVSVVEKRWKEEQQR